MTTLEAAGTVPAAPSISQKHIRQEKGQESPAAAAAAASAAVHQNNTKDQHQQQQELPDISSRTSWMTESVTGSWMTTSERSSASAGDVGVDVPPLLQSLFGLDFLPFSTILEEDENEAAAEKSDQVDQQQQQQQQQHDNGGVPHSVEITSEEQGDPSATTSLKLENHFMDDQGEVCAVHRHCPTRVPTAEREELQKMLRHHDKTKKRPGKRVKNAMKGVLSKLGNRVRVRRLGSSSLASSSSQTNQSKSLTVDTRRAAHLPPLSPLTTTTSTPASLTPIMTHTDNQSSISSHRVVDDQKSSSSTRVASEAQTKQSLLLQQQVQLQEHSVQQTQQEIEQLQYTLAASIEKYQAQLQQLQQTQQQLQQQVEQAQLQQRQMHQSCPANLEYHQEHAKEENEGEESSVPKNNPRVLKRSESASFMRVSDLDLAKTSIPEEEQVADRSSCSASMSSLSQSAHSKIKSTTAAATTTTQAAVVDSRTPEFLLMDHYLLEIVQQLLRKGYNLVTDEGDRFTPTRETEKFLAQNKKRIDNNMDPSWSIQPWAAACDQSVLVWTGHVPHEGFGSTWPVVKGRAILNASAKTVLHYLWDSDQVPKYNPLSQGRKDIYTLQDNVDTCADHSPYGLAGCAKIVQSLNKHRLLPKAMEMKSLLYARPLQEHSGSYILVSRSVWETQSGTTHDTQPKNVIRSEMLLGCTLLRALDDNRCEMTQLTHAYSPGVPEVLVRRSAPGQCSSLIQALQAQFPPPK